MSNVPNQREITANDQERTHPEMTAAQEMHERRTGAIDAKGRRVSATGAFLLIAGLFFVGAIVVFLFAMN